MALAVKAPSVAPSGAVFVDEADGNAAFGTGESSRPNFSATQKSPGTIGNPEGKKIDFNMMTFGSLPNYNDRVITTSTGTHKINWGSSAGVSVDRALWLGRIGGDNITIERFEKAPSSARLSKRSLGTVYDDYLELTFHEINQQYYDYDMYIQLHWTLLDRSGTTTSGVFAVSNGTSGSSEYSAAADRIGKLTAGDDNNADRELNGVEDDDSTSSADPISTAVTASPSATATGSASISTLGASAGDSGGGGGSNLPAGAIAGIVIGSVLGISLIAFLIWFFLRRHRRADHVSNGAYDSGHSPHQYLTDKETHARVTESPHSPYSDDGQQPQHPPGQHHRIQLDDPEAVAPASAVSGTERHPLAPYGEEEHTPIAARSVEDMTRNGARSSTPNVNTNVSHLIEDGMTEDEIRRLEEEERALDDAIEQAGQGQGQSQGQGQRR
ncbi:uncharacterized protein ColSpa_00296 [Colletotrichum spaethianum]|uniref:Uncharacterized protein n=1 Tax=Colletotrichum spaethianum TaxID=700344 RepID=A0AA37NVC2_9PEZI|nr:uncharacterized protein ColSpa_00296 [Colletotrichum spaethianum]GKT40115.1 hypothetical protein ColSpa_00296 [Colletotrichum spaethianum]